MCARVHKHAIFCIILTNNHLSFITVFYGFCVCAQGLHTENKTIKEKKKENKGGKTPSSHGSESIVTSFYKHQHLETTFTDKAQEIIQFDCTKPENV